MEEHSVNGDRSKTTNILKLYITQHHIDIQVMLWRVIPSFMIFAVFDHMSPLTLCLNFSLRKYLLTYNGLQIVKWLGLRHYVCATSKHR